MGRLIGLTNQDFNQCQPRVCFTLLMSGHATQFSTKYWFEADRTRAWGCNGWNRGAGKLLHGAMDRSKAWIFEGARNLMDKFFWVWSHYWWTHWIFEYVSTVYITYLNLNLTTNINKYTRNFHSDWRTWQMEYWWPFDFRFHIVTVAAVVEGNSRARAMRLWESCGGSHGANMTNYSYATGPKKPSKETW